MGNTRNLNIIIIGTLITALFDWSQFADAIWKCDKPSEKSRCVTNEQKCRTDSDCIIGVCAPIKGGRCEHSGMNCKENKECCDGNCADDNNNGTKGCSCFVLGEPCQTSRHCCTGACDFVGSSNQKTCIVSKCASDRLDCKTGSDCCSGFCNPDKKCGCLGDGAKCKEEFDCCSFFCEPNTKTCARKADGEVCDFEEECCSGACLILNGQEFPSCTKCLSAGEPCSNSEECCGNCDRQKDMSLLCGTSFPGDPCNLDSDCDDHRGNFTVSCVDNRCDCKSVGLDCRDSFDCCQSSGNETCNTAKGTCE